MCGRRAIRDGTETPRRFFAVQSVVLTAFARIIEKAVRYSTLFFPFWRGEIDNWRCISCGEKASSSIRSIEQLIDKSRIALFLRLIGGFQWRNRRQCRWQSRVCGVMPEFLTRPCFKTLAGRRADFTLSDVRGLLRTRRTHIASPYIHMYACTHGHLRCNLFSCALQPLHVTALPSAFKICKERRHTARTEFILGFVGLMELI